MKTFLFRLRMDHGWEKQYRIAASSPADAWGKFVFDHLFKLTGCFLTYDEVQNLNSITIEEE